MTLHLHQVFRTCVRWQLTVGVHSGMEQYGDANQISASFRISGKLAGLSYPLEDCWSIWSGFPESLPQHGILLDGGRLVPKWNPREWSQNSVSPPRLTTLNVVVRESSQKDNGVSPPRLTAPNVIVKETSQKDNELGGLLERGNYFIQDVSRFFFFPTLRNYIVTHHFCSYFASPVGHSAHVHEFVSIFKSPPSCSCL